jgi:hypothetical protein
MLTASVRPPRSGGYRLLPAYVDMVTRDMRAQLSEAGVRLSFVLNQVTTAPQ